MSHPAVTYRADIDGLRAVAVLLVVFYHAQIGLFPGGYIGVDVFFVISGYLITGIIAGEMREGRFSFLSFYERRARRILPALLTVILATSIFAFSVLIADELMLFGRSVMASLFFYANSFFRHQTDYFGPGADSLPLLHLWSLSVEEQFYIGFPVILLIMIRFTPRHIHLIVLAATLIFFSFSAADAVKFKVGAFFLTGDRIWELLLGATAQLLPLSRPAPFRAFAQQLFGLAAILWSGATLGPALGLPTLEVLIPCLAAALILRSPAPTSGWAMGPLSLKGPVAIGKISYSLYLWHWPLLVSLTFLANDPTDIRIRALTVLAAFLAAAASYRFVEQPVRRPHGPISRRKLVAGTLTGLTLLSALAAIAIQTKGMRYKLGTDYERIWAEASEIRRFQSLCHPTGSKDQLEPCLYGAAGVVPKILVVGDSQAGNFAAVLDQIGSELGFSYLKLSYPACPPIFEGYAESPTINKSSSYKVCMQNIARISDTIQKNKDIKLIFIAMNYSLYTDSRFSQSTNREDKYDFLLMSLKKAIGRFRDNKLHVVLVGPLPALDYSPGREIANFFRGSPSKGGTPIVDFEKLNQRFIDFIRSESDSDGVSAYLPSDALCTSSSCPSIVDGKPLYLDQTHMSAYGAAFQAPLLKKKLEEILRSIEAAAR